MASTKRHPPTRMVKCSLSVFRIGNVFDSTFPACPTIQARISLFGCGTLERGRVFHARAYCPCNLFRNPTDHRGGYPNRQIGRESIPCQKLFHDGNFASREPEMDSRQILRDLHELGKMFHALQVSAIVPAKIRNFFALAGNQFRHCIDPARIGKTFHASLVGVFHNRKNIHTLQSVA